MATRVPARLSASEGRRFARTVGLAFTVLGGLVWWRGHAVVAGVALAIGVALLIASVVAPTRLGPVQRAWMGLAMAISKITTPLSMGLVYFAVVTPIGLLRRRAGKNALLRPRDAKSFWVARGDDAQRRTGMERQF